MTRREFIQRNRKWHRYLGVVLGIQFLLWTLGGLYFSWTNIDEIRGDHLKKKSFISLPQQDLVSPSSFLNSGIISSDRIVSIEVITILNQPTYRVIYTSKTGKNSLLFDALTGQQRAPLTEKEATLVAMKGLNITAAVTEVEHLKNTNKHHEYRDRPLPAYAVTFAKPANTTIYVSENCGDIQTFRSNKWRVFDFLWMLHTMDYEGRDNFNNILLRAFAIFGLFTILSGFSLYIFTSRIFRRKTSK